jgi:predicted DsbA family dithiol-disulfide isomerase
MSIQSNANANVEPVTIDVVSDVVCPWCFIGKRRLEKAIALRPDIPVEVRWHPYFLNDWIPREGIGREEYLTKKFGSVDRYTRASPSASPRRLPPTGSPMTSMASSASRTRSMPIASSCGHATPAIPRA